MRNEGLQFFGGMMNEKVFYFCLGLVPGLLAILLWTALGRKPADPGGLIELDKGSQREAASVIAGLERTIGSLRERNGELEARALRLEQHIGNARTISYELGKSLSAVGSDIDRAIAVFGVIARQVEDLNRILSAGPPGGGGPGGVAGLEDE